jgi:riboflavin kinase, archaea type
LPQIFFEGTVFSGQGRGKKFVELPWFKGQVEEKLGFSPYPGTLNLVLTGKKVENRRLLEVSNGLMVKPQTGYYSGVMFRASIDGLECAVVIPIMPNYPNDVLEVIAPIYLREKLKLADGSLVAVSVNV